MENRNTACTDFKGTHGLVFSKEGKYYFKITYIISHILPPHSEDNSLCTLSQFSSFILFINLGVLFLAGDSNVPWSTQGKLTGTITAVLLVSYQAKYLHESDITIKFLCP